MVAGRPRITSAAKGLKEWRALVANCAQEQTNMWTCSPNEAVGLHLVFFMPRPKGHYGKSGLKPSAPEYPVKKPDLDKLVRAVGDALVPVLLHDDNQVVWISATKQYACKAEPPGVQVTLIPHGPK
jgi:Holliday junction resolvase RusA-like endonuclease